MTQPSRTPGEDALAELASAIGIDAARLVARRFGGTTIYVPRTIGDDHPLRAALGADIAAKLAHWFGGGRINVPKQAERKARVRQLHRAGALTIAAIALETGFSERHVYRLLSEQGDGQDEAPAPTRDDRQPDLFGE